MPLWIKMLALAGIALAVDRLLLGLERRGWIYYRGAGIRELD